MGRRRGDAASARPWAVSSPTLAAVALTFGLAACATAPQPSRLAGGGARPRAYNRPYQVRGRWYVPTEQPGYDRVGVASWYSYESRSRTTADGEVFDARLATAAHTTLPIPSWLEVTNLDTGRSARIRLNDRGPFVPGRIIDLSRAAAQELGFLGRGTARVRVRYLGPAEPVAGEPTLRWARQDRPPPSRPAPVPVAQARAAPPAYTPLASPQSEVAEDAAMATDGP